MEVRKSKSLEQQCFDWIAQVKTGEMRLPGFRGGAPIKGDPELLDQARVKMREAWNLVRRASGDPEVGSR
jgi:hypothetical protein